MFCMWGHERDLCSRSRIGKTATPRFGAHWAWLVDQLLELRGIHVRFPAITSNDTQTNHFTGEELQVKFLWDSEENSLKY